MYEVRGVGVITDTPQLVYDMVWNPPGWGSGKAEVTSFLGRRVALAMVVGIKPGGHIPFHTDNPAAENGLGNQRLDRFHFVLATNTHCWNFHDGVWQRLEEGRVYTMDPSKQHASINLGDTTRLHLVVDLYPH